MTAATHSVRWLRLVSYKCVPLYWFIQGRQTGYLLMLMVYYPLYEQAGTAFYPHRACEAIACIVSNAQDLPSFMGQERFPKQSPRRQEECNSRYKCPPAPAAQVWSHLPVPGNVLHTEHHLHPALSASHSTSLIPATHHNKCPVAPAIFSHFTLYRHCQPVQSQM